jgi:uncharacterized membrane protein
MLPRALIGDIKPENWLGFIDAIYAIILTLLLIELPSAIMDIIKEYEQHPNEHWVLLNSFVLSIFGYLAVFIIVYDIWAHHRVVIAEAVISRINLSLGIFMLFMCSLLPPLYHVISALKHDYLTKEIGTGGAYSLFFWDTRLVLYVINFSIYGCIALIATKDIRFLRRQRDVPSSRMIALRQLKNSSIAMVLVIFLVSLFSLMGYMTPPAPIVVIALCTHLPVDKLMLQLRRRVLPH